jgi:hypothetical protein
LCLPTPRVKKILSGIIPSTKHLTAEDEYVRAIQT